MTVHTFDRVRDDASLEVAGEYYHQDGVQAARSPRAGEIPGEVPLPPAGYFKAFLVPEPDNPKDRNAVRVFLWAGGGLRLAGYIGRDDAPGWQPVFARIADGGDIGRAAIACDAALVAERDITGVLLHLGTPAECMVEMLTGGEPAAHPWAGRRVYFAGASQTQLGGAIVDRDAQAMAAEWAGLEVARRLSKQVGLVVEADRRSAADNVAKAREYGIEVVSEPDFLVGIGLPADQVRRDLRWAAR
jgi:hypothetical protein